jgi:hypothetical protein
LFDPETPGNDEFVCTEGFSDLWERTERAFHSSKLDICLRSIKEVLIMLGRANGKEQGLSVG